MQPGDLVEVWSYGAWHLATLLVRADGWSQVRTENEGVIRTFWASNRFVRAVEVN